MMMTPSKLRAAFLTLLMGAGFLLHAKAATIAENPTGTLMTSYSGNTVKWTFSNFAVLDATVTGTGELLRPQDMNVSFSVLTNPYNSIAQVYFSTVDSSGIMGGPGRTSAFTIAYDVQMEILGVMDPFYVGMGFGNYKLPGASGTMLTAVNDGMNQWSTGPAANLPMLDIAGVQSTFRISNTFLLGTYESEPQPDRAIWLTSINNQFIYAPEPGCLSLLGICSGIFFRRRRKNLSGD